MKNKLVGMELTAKKYGKLFTEFARKCENSKIGIDHPHGEFRLKDKEAYDLLEYLYKKEN